MPNTKQNNEVELSKFQRYRNNKQAKGMKLLRVWVPDVKRPEFAKEAKHQALLLRSRTEEMEALVFIQAHGDWSNP